MRQIRNYALLWALVLSSVAMAALGWRLQSGLPAQELKEVSWIEVPFLYPETAQRLSREEEQVTVPSEEMTTEPVTEAATEPTTEPSTEPTAEPTTEPPTEPVTEPPTEPAGPLAVLGEDESYFDDALFIGDSRTDGLRLYCPLGEADYFCTTGMTIFGVFEEKAPNKDLVEQTLEQVLGQKQYGKIYITLGLNELSEEDEVLKAEFLAVMARIRSVQPDAKLILHAITPLGKEKSASKPYFAKERVDQVNALMAQIAGEQGAFYLDASPVFAGEDGYLIEELSFDGCHLYAKNYSIWGQFLCENTV